MKHGPASRLTAAEIEEIVTKPSLNIIHRAHLQKDDFKKQEYMERCGGCSAMLRGMRPQPHSQSASSSN